MSEIPKVEASDSEDVVWALQTAETLAARGERTDAIVWLQRAARAASEAGHMTRASELSIRATQLAGAQEALAHRSLSAPPDIDVEIEVVASNPYRPSTKPPSSENEVSLSGGDVISLRPDDVELVDEGAPKAPPLPRELVAAPPLPSVKKAPPLPSKKAPPPPSATRAGPPRPDLPAQREPLATPIVDLGTLGLGGPAPSNSSEDSASEDVAGRKEVSFVTSVANISRSEPPPLPVAGVAASRTAVASAENVQDASSSSRLAVMPSTMPPLNIGQTGSELRRSTKPPSIVPPAETSPVDVAQVIANPDAGHEVDPEQTRSELDEHKRPTSIPAPLPKGPSAGLAEAASESVQAALAAPTLSPQLTEQFLEPPAASSEPRAAAPDFAEGIDLAAVEAFSDLPEEVRAAFGAQARILNCAPGDEVPFDALAFVVSGSVVVSASMVDVPAQLLHAGSTIRNQGSIEAALALKLVASDDGAKVACWGTSDLNAALESCPWVDDELRGRANATLGICGVTLGMLGERLDFELLSQVVTKLDVRVFEPGEEIVAQGARFGIGIVGLGDVQISSGETLSCGDLLFPDGVLSAAPTPARAVAGTTGAIVLIGTRGAAQELMATCPPLVEIFAGM
jgi:hypothetical protein